MAKENKVRFDVASRISAGRATAPTVSPDDILFKPVALPPPTAADEAPASNEETLLRFGSQLPAGDLITMHRIAYWQRVPLYEVLSEAIRMYGATQPEAANPLPEKERATRKLPRA
ncbi:MAG: hypothetical protein EOO56_05885 [Hymenobacter sp.]|jgi:hypothetical protein|nr:MAG: hypothetical protein EOO56_05885 [Hymenobacter sp.]